MGGVESVFLCVFLLCVCVCMWWGGRRPLAVCTSSSSRAPLALTRPRSRTEHAQEVAKAAYMDRVDLSAHGFYATPDVTGFGGNRPFNYFTYGGC